MFAKQTNKQIKTKKQTFPAYIPLTMYLGVQENRGDIKLGEGCEILETGDLQDFLKLHYMHGEGENDHFPYTKDTERKCQFPG